MVQPTEGTPHGRVGKDPCPACGSAVEVPGDVMLGEVLICEHCGAELEVIGREPLRIDLFEEEEK